MHGKGGIMLKGQAGENSGNVIIIMHMQIVVIIMDDYLNEEIPLLLINYRAQVKVYATVYGKALHVGFFKKKIKFKVFLLGSTIEQTIDNALCSGNNTPCSQV